MSGLIQEDLAVKIYGVGGGDPAKESLRMGTMASTDGCGCFSIAFVFRTVVLFAGSMLISHDPHQKTAHCFRIHQLAGPHAGRRCTWQSSLSPIQVATSLLRLPLPGPMFSSGALAAFADAADGERRGGRAGEEAVPDCDMRYNV